MNKQQGLFVGKFLLLTFFMITISACVTAQYEKLAVNIEIEEPPRLEIFNVAVNSIDSKTIITGKLHRKSHGRTVIPGHLDIKILSSEGELLHELYTKYNRKSLKARDSTFSAELPIIVPKRSTVHIKFHKTAKHVKC